MKGLGLIVRLRSINTVEVCDLPKFGGAVIPSFEYLAALTELSGVQWLAPGSVGKRVS